MTNLQEQLLEIIGQHGGQALETPHMTSRLAELGIDSLRFLQVVVRIEEVFGCQVFSIDNVSTVETIDDLANLVERAQRVAVG